LALFSFFSGYRTLQRQIRWAQDDLKKLEPQHQAAIQTRNDLAAKRSVLEEIQGWQKSRMAWSAQLAALQQITPAAIQLTELRVAQSMVVVSNYVAARAFDLRLAGKTSESSGASVSALQQSLTAQPPLTGLVDTAVIPPGSFRRDPTLDVSSSGRIFEIVCRYRLLTFE
jgi:hypothetical protein